MSEEVVDRLDRIAAILSLAFADQIADVSERIRGNAIADALLDGAQDWTKAGTLQDQVAKATSKTTRTVRAELATLVSIGAMTARGPQNAREYKTTGLL